MSCVDNISGDGIFGILTTSAEPDADVAEDVGGL